MAQGIWASKGGKAKRLKDLEQENSKLKRLVAELSLDNQILTEDPHSPLGYRPPAPTAWQVEVPLVYGKVEGKQRFTLCQAVPEGAH